MTQPGKDGVAQWGGAALPDLIEAMAGRSRQLWLRLVIGVLIACIVGPSLGAPLTVGWYVAWSLLQLAEVAWTRRAQRMSREQAVIGGVVLVALGSTVLAALGAAAILSGNSWLLVCGVLAPGRRLAQRLRRKRDVPGNLLGHGGSDFRRHACGGAGGGSGRGACRYAVCADALGHLALCRSSGGSGRRSACAAVSKGGERIQRRISRPGQSRNPHTAERRARHGSDYVFR